MGVMPMRGTQLLLLQRVTHLHKPNATQAPIKSAMKPKGILSKGGAAGDKAPAVYKLPDELPPNLEIKV